MSSMVAKDSGGGDFELVDEGLYPAVCFSIVDIGMQEKPATYGGGKARQVVVTLEFPTVEIQTDEGPMPAHRSKFYTLSLHENANLRRDLESWRGKTFTEEELAGFDIVNVLAKPCNALIEHVTRNEKTRDVIGKIMKASQGQSTTTSKEPFFYDTMNHDEETFQRVPEWLQKKVVFANGQQHQPEASHAPGDGVDGDDIPFSPFEKRSLV